MMTKQIKMTWYCCCVYFLDGGRRKIMAKVVEESCLIDICMLVCICLNSRSKKNFSAGSVEKEIGLVARLTYTKFLSSVDSYAPLFGLEGGFRRRSKRTNKPGFFHLVIVSNCICCHLHPLCQFSRYGNPYVWRSMIKGMNKNMRAIGMKAHDLDSLWLKGCPLTLLWQSTVARESS
jgi:hypothetical protein